MYRLEDSSEAGGFRYLLVEPFLDGKYIKVGGERSGREKAERGGVGATGANVKTVAAFLVLHCFAFFIRSAHSTRAEREGTHDTCDHGLSRRSPSV